MFESSILFLGKADDKNCGVALEYLRQNFSQVTDHLGRWGDPFPKSLHTWQGDYIISYLSRWVVPQSLLNHAMIAAINFHPAPPEYPGIGCNNFALYEDAKEYGVTCHYMSAKVDTGRIIKVNRFPIFPEDGVDELLERTYEHQLALFMEIAQIILKGEKLPSSNEFWTRQPFSRKQFNELFRITPDMGREEVLRRIRAISYKSWQPYMEFLGLKFEYKPEDHHPWTLSMPD